jgi:hypothetical protein
MAKAKRNFGPVATMMAAPALLATIAAAYTAFWFYNASAMKSRIVQWAAERQTLGDAAEIGIVGVSGFPMRMAVDLENVAVAFHRGETSWSLKAPRLALVSQVFSPRSFTIALPDASEIARTSPSGRDALVKTGGGAELAVGLNSLDALRSATFTAANLSFSGTWGGHALTSPLGVADATVTVIVEPPIASNKDQTAPTARLAATAHGVRWPKNLAFPLGPEVASFDLDAISTGPINAGPAYNALQQWREAGGMITVRRVSLRWGASTLDGTGTFAVDPRLQPIASLTARVEGFVPLVDVLDAAGMIRDSDATLARLVLGREMPPSGPANLSLSVRDGVVYAGPLALVRVPQIPWPGMPEEARTPSGAPLMKPGVDISPDGSVRRKGDPV